MKKGPTVVIALILALGALGNAYAVGYSYTSLDYPGASYTQAFGINDGGTIVGVYKDASGLNHGFSLSGGTYTPINYPGALDSPIGGTLLGGVNDAGTIVGTYFDASALPHGFSLSGGTYTPINYPGFVTLTWASGISNAGAIVGYYDDTSGQHGFSLSGTSYTSLDYPGALYTWASGINNRDTIVGWYFDASAVQHGFSLSGGTYTPIDYPGASYTQAFGINDGGTIVGTYFDTSGLNHGFSLSGGTYTPLDYPGTVSTTQANGINNAGTIVGEYGDATGNMHGFMATPGPVQPSLTVTLFGTGSGDVTSTPSGIDCGSTCSASFASGTALTLTGTPLDPFRSCFIGWGAPCSGYGTCDFTLTSSTSLVATFQPAGADFCDVTPGYWAETYIDTIFTFGITTGCVSAATPIDRRYCPSEDVTRDQMAAFIIRGLYGENFTYTQTPYYTDVPATDIFFKYIQKLKDFAMTTTSGTYLPGEGVSRGQMAAFLVRALQVKAGQPTESFTYTQAPYFTDVPTNNPYFKYVQRLKDLGITTVTGTYGVDEIVPRDQMAAFIARAFLGLQ